MSLALVAVAKSVDGLDDAGVLGVDLDSLAELTDGLIDCSAVGDSAGTPAFLKQRLAMHHIPVGIVQQDQDLQFFCSEFNGRIATSGSKL